MWLFLILTIAAAVLAIAGSVDKFEPPVQKAVVKGEKLLYSRRFEAAEKEFRRAIEITSRKRDIYIFIIQAHLVDDSVVGRRGKELAADYVRELLDLNDKKKLDKQLDREESKGCLLLYGNLCIELDRHTESISALEIALEMSPDDPVILNGLGYAYAESGLRLDRALELTRRAVKASPHDSAFIDSLGWTYYKLGRGRDALRELRRAVNLCPTNAELRYHLGAIYALLGKNVEAAIELKKSLAIDPGYAEARILLNGISRSSRSNASKV